MIIGKSQREIEKMRASGQLVGRVLRELRRMVVPGVTTIEINDAADQMICLDTPAPFYCIGGWYQDFTQVTDAEVAGYLARRAAGSGGAVPPSPLPRAS